jgi:hypothetical protein
LNASVIVRLLAGTSRLDSPFDWTDVLVVAAWGLAGLLFAIRFFRWGPRTG